MGLTISDILLALQEVEEEHTGNPSPDPNPCRKWRGGVMVRFRGRVKVRGRAWASPSRAYSSRYRK